jgi:hypothetical protein
MKRLVMTRLADPPSTTAASVLPSLGRAGDDLGVECGELATVDVLVEQVVREAIDAGLSLRETSERVVRVLSGTGACFSYDELRTWLRAYALNLI